MITTSIVFDHRNRTKKNDNGPLEVRVTVDRKPYYINTGVRVRACEYKYGMVINLPNAEELNARLAIIVKKVEKEINDCIEESRPIDVAYIKKKVLESNMESEEHRTAFIDWCDEQLPLLPISEGTRKHYDTTVKVLREYDKLRRWSDLTTEGILLWDAYLRTLTKPQSKTQKMLKIRAKKLSDAGIYNYHKTLKALLGRAESIGKISRNPYSLLKGRFKRGDKESVEYLTEDEMQRILDLKLEGGTLLSLARDVFVFQMFTGMAYSDAMAFDISNYKNENGKWITRQQRIKSGVPFVSRLLPPVVEVLEKYDMQLPYIDASDYNSKLKVIGEMCCISTEMHSHLARHTFATYMLRNGVELVNLAKMMGHKNTKQTERYAKVLALSVHEDFDMIEAKIKNRK